LRGLLNIFVNPKPSRKLFFLFSFVFLAALSKGQNRDSIAPLGQEWTLQQCVNYAWTHNLQVKQADLARKIARNNYTASKGNLLPSVNGFASHTYNFGRTIDPFTNTFANSEVLSEDFYLQASFTIFGGLQNLNTVKQNEAAYEASGYDLQANKNTLALSIASGYLQILLNRELLQEAKDQHEVTAQQVEKTQKLVDAGSLAKGNLYDVQAQEANDEVNIVNAENQLDIAMLSLAQLLDIDSVQLFKIAVPQITIPDNPAINSPDLIYSQALTNQPDIFSARLKWESSEKARLAAAGALYPKLSLAASLGTGYSGSDENVITTVQGVTQIGTVGTFPNIYPIDIPNEVYSYQLIPFRTQLNDNFNKSFGFRLTIPIFNGLQSNMAFKNAKLNELNAQLNYETTELNLRKNVQQAYADALGSLKKYHATQKSVQSFTEAYNYTRARYDAGAATSLDYNTAKNNLAKAESDLLQAKYTYVFKLKVLDYYEGKPLKL
jgi:outer membrane protein